LIANASRLVTIRSPFVADVKKEIGLTIKSSLEGNKIFHLLLVVKEI
jgi:hypothetical protein